VGRILMIQWHVVVVPMLFSNLLAVYDFRLDSFPFVIPLYIPECNHTSCQSSAYNFESAVVLQMAGNKRK
jgi:hypothetical protein